MVERGKIFFLFLFRLRRNKKISVFQSVLVVDGIVAFLRVFHTDVFVATVWVWLREIALPFAAVWIVDRKCSAALERAKIRS